MPSQVFAVDFEIEKTEIHAHLKENGAVQVTEEHRYQFDGAFNGVTRSLIPKRNTVIENFRASEQGTSLEVEQDDELYKVYRSGDDETVTVTFDYTIQHAVETDTELAQFYWPFFDSSNETPYQNMDIFVYPPQITDDVLALGYDEAQDRVDIQDGGVVHFALGQVEDGENGDIRVAYDASIFANGLPSTDESIQQDMLADKTEQEEKAAAFSNRQNLLGKLAPFVVVGSFVAVLALIMMAVRKKRQALWEATRTSNQHGILPKENMSLPAIMYYMGGISKGGEMLSASLLDLVRKGFVKRENEDQFKVVDHHTDHEHESMLINWLFYKVGKDGLFSPSELKAYMEEEENQNTYSKDNHSWLTAVKQEMDQQQLYEKLPAYRWTVGLSSIGVLVFAILFGIHQLWMWMFLSLFGFIGLLGFALFYFPRTTKGTRIKKQWETFSTKYEQITNQDWNEWMSDEQMQAIIYGVGTNNKKMMEKNKTLVESPNVSAVSSSVTSSDMVMLMLLSTTLTSQFNEANHTVSASSSTSTAGTGAGVGGGGGGSGAF